jgi:hypothetical protein
VIGPFFIKITGISAKHRAARNGTLPWTRSMVWQQDGAPPHFGRTVCAFLNEKFPVWIDCCESAEWPPIPPDLTPYDFSKVGYNE